MSSARKKIQIIAEDKISPYNKKYIPKSTKNLKIKENSKYDTKYILLFFYIVLGLIFIVSFSS